MQRALHRWLLRRACSPKFLSRQSCPFRATANHFGFGHRRIGTFSPQSPITKPSFNLRLQDTVESYFSRAVLASSHAYRLLTLARAQLSYGKSVKKQLKIVKFWTVVLEKTFVVLGLLFKFTHIPSPPVHQEMHGSLELSDLSTEGHTHTIWDDGVKFFHLFLNTTPVPSPSELRQEFLLNVLPPQNQKLTSFLASNICVFPLTTWPLQLILCHTLRFCKCSLPLRNQILSCSYSWLWSLVQDYSISFQGTLWKTRQS